MLAGLSNKRRSGAPVASLDSGAPTTLGLSRIVCHTDESVSDNGTGYSSVNLPDPIRMAVAITPTGRGSLEQQALEIMQALEGVLRGQSRRMVPTVQTVFLRESSDQAKCKRLMAEFHGADQPLTTYVVQPPCNGAALAVEAWAIGGRSVQIERRGRRVVVVSYEGIRWVHYSGNHHALAPGYYRQSVKALEQMGAALADAGSHLKRVVRAWFYLGNITQTEGGHLRYQLFNRAREECYHHIGFCSNPKANGGFSGFPASTGIGMLGRGLATSCVAVETSRPDARLLALENPDQTPAFAYPGSGNNTPKFSRGMALVLSDYVTTWISGTASIVGSESRYPDDVERQTEQTIDNIQRLISPENFACRGVAGAGAALCDVAKIRVYLKDAGDYLRCKAICEKRFGPVPAIYVGADICRPELLVEIEGVAFSRRSLM
jgi:enamine deaminase RidA (YjgF/YER057c/UK114 family)